MHRQNKKAPPSAAQAELERLQAAQQRRMGAVIADYQKGKTDKEKGEIIQAGYQKLYTEFWPQYAKLIGKSQGGVQVRARLAALELAQMGQKPDLAAKILADLIRENRDLPEAATVAASLRYSMAGPGAQAQIKKSLQALGQSKNATVRAAALLALADVTKDTDAKQAVPLYRDVIAKYPTTPYAKSAKGAIFEAENLQIGMIAPEIQGLDQEGKDFRLSEYRGKVVVLDFWGFW